ncbi:MAG: ABC transporter permease subunit [Acidobacteria bacterium]|nr:ABC transporter permease subunit [Acidobacteriota bacterium]
MSVRGRHLAALLVLGLASMLAAGGAVAQQAAARPVVVGSKPFGESYLLAELFAQILEARGMAVTRRFGLGGTEIAFPALRQGAIDVFPEYTGSGLLVILKAPMATDPAAVFDTVSREFAARYDVRWLAPLGFENTYAMSVRTEMATRLGLRTLSDAARVSGRLRAGFTADFIGLPDGLPALRATYGLAPVVVNALAPALKYQALVAGDVDIIDAYSTDGLLDRYPLTVLADDKRVFPPYDAAALVRGALAREQPAAVAALGELSGRIDVARMRRLNARVEVEGQSVAAVARAALVDLGLAASAANGTTTAVASAMEKRAGDESFARYLWVRRQAIAAMSARHLALAGVALAAAIVVGLGVGLALARRPGAEGATRAFGLLQTIPGIALLAFLLPVLGIGAVPAMVALFLYALYPIVRGTVTGVGQADRSAVEAAVALGMTPRQVLLWVQVPLAVPVIMAGARTAAVTSVGTATLAAFVGGGGLGDPIVAGLALADTRMILSGAVPAAVLAVVVDVVLARAERWLTPRGLVR